MARFKLKENEKLLYSEIHDWFTIIHRAKHGTLYVTDKRVVFCATATWKQVLIELYEEQKSKNIRWEADFNQIGFKDTKENLLLPPRSWIKLDEKETGIAVADGFIDLINKLKNT